MRVLQLLVNKYILEKQTLEFKLEKEINSPYPSNEVIDDIFGQLSLLELKDGYLTKLLINISNARDDKHSNDPNE